jgi:hypothetical protein
LKSISSGLKIIAVRLKINPFNWFLLQFLSLGNYPYLVLYFYINILVLSYYSFTDGTGYTEIYAEPSAARI